MRFAHIADVHLRLYKRQKEYYEVFSKLYGRKQETQLLYDFHSILLTSDR